MLGKILEYFFYSPNKVAKKNSSINIGEGTVLLKNTRFRLHSNDNVISIGSNSMLGCTFIFETTSGKITIGDRTFINSGTNLISISQISIGSDVTIAWGCTIYDHNSHSIDYRERIKDIECQLSDYKSGQDFTKNKNWSTVKSQPITIKNNVWIGFNVIILKGVTIGEGAIISAGSVVRSDVEPWTIVAGNPAVVIKRLKNE